MLDYTVFGEKAMKLSAKPIINWCNVNMYAFGNQWNVNAGDPLTLYFQVIDTDQAISGNNQGFGIFSGITPVWTTAGLRYLLGIGSSNQPYGITVTFPSIDNSKALTYIATQADPNDSSIWVVRVPASQTPGGGNVLFAVQEGSQIRRFSVMNMIAVDDPLNNGSC
jgi:hypothetical protein